MTEWPNKRTGQKPKHDKNRDKKGNKTMITNFEYII